LLGHTDPGHGGEIQLTDALLSLSKKQKMYAYEFEGNRFDAGDKLGYLKAIIAYGLQHGSLGSKFKEHIIEVAASL
jgi:UTP--glucose-1-phosphate uridylyltransferase